MRPTFAITSALALTLGLLVMGCQTYDFEPVSPLAVDQQSFPSKVVGTVFAPTLMLVLDKSGSMTNPINSSLPACTVNGQLCGETSRQQCPDTCGSPGCTPSCPTRISEVRRAMGDFLTNNATLAMMGLTSFPVPSNDACAAATQGNIMVKIPATDDAATLQATANNINTTLQTITPGGGTPTSATLKNLATYTGLLNSNRSNFIMLLTDGEPNCNAANPNTCCAGSSTCGQCRCTALDPTQCASQAGICATGCLDQDGTAASITSLKASGISTFVVGFGSDTQISGGDQNAPAALSAMALAGGEARQCTTNADCGAGDTCNTATSSTPKYCNHPYYQASNSQELGAVLAKIKGIVSKTPCQQLLSPAPTDARFISVLVNGTDAASGVDTWQYDATSGLVVFKGALCNQLQNSTPQNPVNIEYRVVQKL